MIAYEADAAQRALCARVAAANGVAIDLRGTAEAGDVRGAALVVMDCEGCERALLEPPLDATIIVELHDFLDPGVGEEIAERFAATHAVEIVPTGPQPPHSELLLSEYRPGPMRWAVMTPR